ncbi:hypothetical protein L9F63_012725, partial [Diploptera punctata]
ISALINASHKSSKILISNKRNSRYETLNSVVEEHVPRSTYSVCSLPIYNLDMNTALGKAKYQYITYNYNAFRIFMLIVHPRNVMMEEG